MQQEALTDSLCYRISDIVVKPEVFEFVLNYLQCTRTYGRIANCDRIINSSLQPALRDNNIDFDNLSTEPAPVGDLVWVQGNWCWNRQGGSTSSQPPSVGSETPTPPVPRREGEPTV